MGIGLAEPVILVHGSSHGAWCWDLLVPELKRLGHDAVAFDLPGAGARAGEPASLSGYRDAVVEQLAGDDILVGHSMGAAVAVVAADARPDLIRHITLLSGPLPVEGPVPELPVNVPLGRRLDLG